MNTSVQLVRAARKALRRNDHVESERLCRALLAQEPHHVDGQFLLGLIALQTQRIALARDTLARAVKYNPRHAMAHTFLGLALHMLGRAADALPHLEQSLQLQPGDLTTLNAHAGVQGALGDFAASLASCDAVLRIDPNRVEAWINRGNALVQLHRPDEALQSYQRALRIKPDFVEVMNNCANVLKHLQRFDEALDVYAQALKIRPDYLEATFNSGVLLGELGRPREAIARYRRTVDIDPNHVRAHYNLAFARLQTGDYTRGWPDYEWRWHEALKIQTRPDFRQPLWLGRKSLRGKTILLHAEAGLGDTLHFCRYVPIVAARGARVIVRVQRPLVGLLRPLKGAHKVLANGARLPAFDYQCPMMSLPLAFGTTLDTIPARVPYLHADAARIETWRKRLGPSAKTTRPRIGLVWCGNPQHKNDRNRSVPLSALLPLLEGDAQWVSLQQEIPAGDAELLARHTALRHFGPQLKDFGDTAALTALMDLVIAVDTSVAHLAGAMGKPVWILLPFNADWRWLRRRHDSPWYPGARLFRQPAIGDWTSVVNKLGRALRARLGEMLTATA